MLPWPSSPASEKAAAAGNRTRDLGPWAARSHRCERVINSEHVSRGLPDLGCVQRGLEFDNLCEASVTSVAPHPFPSLPLPFSYRLVFVTGISRGRGYPFASAVVFRRPTLLPSPCLRAAIRSRFLIEHWVSVHPIEHWVNSGLSGVTLVFLTH